MRFIVLLGIAADIMKVCSFNGKERFIVFMLKKHFSFYILLPYFQTLTFLLLERDSSRSSSSSWKLQEHQ